MVSRIECATSSGDMAFMKHAWRYCTVVTNCTATDFWKDCESGYPLSIQNQTELETDNK